MSRGEKMSDPVVLCILVIVLLFWGQNSLVLVPCTWLQSFSINIIPLKPRIAVISTQTVISQQMAYPLIQKRSLIRRVCLAKPRYFAEASKSWVRIPANIHLLLIVVVWIVISKGTHTSSWMWALDRGQSTEKYPNAQKLENCVYCVGWPICKRLANVWHLKSF